jgi:hypothetical protein
MKKLRCGYVAPAMSKTFQLYADNSLVCGSNGLHCRCGSTGIFPLPSA